LEKVIVEFTLEAKTSYERLRNGAPFLSQLALRYYKALFDFPPEDWLRVRRNLGHDTFTSDSHCALDIRGTLADTHPLRTLRITHFEVRKRPPKAYN
jgi:hypothetical protein